MGEPQPAVFDARPYQLRGQEPFADIMAAVGALLPGQDLVLRNTFDPQPLKAVLAAQGFAYEARQLGPEDWQVIFHRSARPADASTLEPELAGRGIDPLQASVRTPQTLRRTPDDATLRVRFDQDPAGFGKEVGDRGYSTSVEHVPGQGYRMRILR